MATTAATNTGPVEEECLRKLPLTGTLGMDYYINIWLIYPKRAYENPYENKPTCLRHLVVPEEEWLHGRTERVDSPLAKDGDREEDQASEDNRPHCKGDANCNKYLIFLSRRVMLQHVLFLVGTHL